jgi:hypothetical protein
MRTLLKKLSWFYKRIEILTHFLNFSLLVRMIFESEIDKVSSILNLEILQNQDKFNKWSVVKV